MSKTILVTGSTDGIGLETARRLSADGHNVILHGRNAEKLQGAATEIGSNGSGAVPAAYTADLSSIKDTITLAKNIASDFSTLDAVINNAGVFGTSKPVTADGLDVRFVVNTVAPYALSMELHALLGQPGRIINVSSAAQSPVNLSAMASYRGMADFEAYAQSKLALTMWTMELGRQRANDDPVYIAVNPGSLLGSKMVKDAFGVDGGDIGIGADILIRAALDPDFSDKSGHYFDNDAGKFGDPHPDALNTQKCTAVVNAVEQIIDASA